MHHYQGNKCGRSPGRSRRQLPSGGNKVRVLVYPAGLQLTKSVIDLAAAHLRRQFLYQAQRGRFGRLDALLELAISARGCVASSLSSGRITVAFVLEGVLRKCATDLDGRLVRISEIADLGARLHDPVDRA